jgi:hypothetical protein
MSSGVLPDTLSRSSCLSFKSSLSYLISFLSFSKSLSKSSNTCASKLLLVSIKIVYHNFKILTHSIFSSENNMHIFQFLNPHVKELILWVRQFAFLFSLFLLLFLLLYTWTSFSLFFVLFIISSQLIYLFGNFALNCTFQNFHFHSFIVYLY